MYKFHFTAGHITTHSDGSRKMVVHRPSLMLSLLKAPIPLFTCLVALAGCTNQEQRPTWPQFRGPGGSASTSKARVPDDFGPDRHVRWKREVPPGHSSPVIWGDRLFLTGYDDSTLAVLCYRRTDGKLLWEKEVPMSGEERLLHRNASPAAPTPVTDGKRVHAYFGAYGLMTLDMKGRLVWKREFPIEDNEFGTGSSPILDGGSLYLVRDVGAAGTESYDTEGLGQQTSRDADINGSPLACP